jgi:hypothetical protein
MRPRDNEIAMLTKQGVSENAATALIDRIEPLRGKKPEPDTPMDKDNLLMQPVDNWDRTDRKGEWGGRILSVPSPAFRENYAQIDWRK